MLEGAITRAPHSAATCAARRPRHARMQRPGLLVTLCALLAATRAAEAVGQPRNLTIQAVAVDEEGEDFLGPEAPVKLNVSWLPPENGRAPKSYSVLVTSASGDGAEEARRGSGSCMEGSVYHVTGDPAETWIALPENRFGAAPETAPELEIEPGCSYRVQVFANPRNSASDAEDATSMVYRVPECVGGRCNCDRALEELPVPEVSARNLYNGSVLISWKVERSLLKSCKISVGIPHLTSSSGLIVYNKTQIFTGTSNENSFIWHEDRLKKGTKIFVTVQDSYGCSGKEGTYTIKRVRQDPFYRKNITAIIFAAIIALCVLFSGLISFVKRISKKQNYALLPFKKKSPKQLTSILQSSRIDALLKNHNVLYIEQEIEEARRKDLADEHELSYGRLREVRELGQGQFGRVYLADLLGAGGPRPVAVKTSLTSLDSARAQLEVRQQLLEEIKITKVAGSHPHLVGLVGCCTLPDNPVCLVLEYMPGGDLLGYLHRMRDATEARDSAHEVASLESPGINSIAETTCTSLGSQSPGTPTSRVFFANEFKLERAASRESEGAVGHAETMRFALEIAKGMEHLEAKGIVHRDLAARNVLMDENLVLKISDFGLSRKGAYTVNGGGARRLPIRWMPPEAIRRRAFTSRSDVWSYGLVLWEIGSLGDFPYPRLSDDELLRHLLEEGGRPLGHEARFAPAEARELMDMCWAAKPERRPDFRQIVLWLEGRLRPDAKCNPAYRELGGDER